MTIPPEKPVFRFAPSPNGALHLGHAYSALLNFDMARKAGGVFLLRIEDIDTTRCNKVLEQQMLEDLHWLGIEWDETPRRQSDHFDNYQKALKVLEDKGLIYPAFMSRGERKKFITRMEEKGTAWPRDPDGAPVHPDTDRNRALPERQKRIEAGDPYSLRLDTHKALELVKDDLHWVEMGAGLEVQSGQIKCEPLAWGDVILARSDVPTSYHLSVVLDDALQGVTHVVRGRDLFHATSMHRLLQALLGLNPPLYHHHDLILASDGRKLSKSDKDTSLSALRSEGVTAKEIRRMVGL